MGRAGVATAICPACRSRVRACPAIAASSAQADAADAPGPPANDQEEIRFASGWSVPGSPDFWTYKLAWEIAEDPQLTEERLSSILEIYSDGLSRAVSQLGDSLQMPVAVFVRDSERHRGRLRIYHAFATNAWITLNARVNSLKRGGNHLLVFELSPQGFEPEVWRKLASIRVSVSGVIVPAAGD